MVMVSRRSVCSGLVFGGLVAGRIAYEAKITDHKGRLANSEVRFSPNLHDDSKVDLVFNQSVFIGIERGDILIRTVNRRMELWDNFQGKAIPGELLHAAIWLGDNAVLDIGYPGIEPGLKNIVRPAEDFLSGSEQLLAGGFENFEPVHRQIEQVIARLIADPRLDGVELLLAAGGREFQRPGKISLSRRALLYFICPCPGQPIDDLRASLPSVRALDKVGMRIFSAVDLQQYLFDRAEMERLMAPTKRRPGIRRRPR
ncbi:hypothetical protein A2276_07645 [candidate division WOR-1 bacterium RIFOXYA12_FULL_43_27]|uniref:Uncharacterized protein n=1 Tax=candidate division WOR-1 bacterium RIFOXYC2_FULL_46_14 TaxID=1802587 RepID=A0A1F4U5S2_UNCSA|nr:MAG: hypothetical protein A2276_07645 [candidate division WOR-1 bacterium RIFOXYA12_FULL_43_27]OGC20473.1 MAG: hypothetical protein A2292_05470 [candidate division WOR-1 bacterium RIFOXYB2_FULL_46_45]OGC31790.1 MAG: hypothetical protein A2232_05980 [candidate division WOR-1 bacterium RIFOXYA2_FULL_46_56]OGC40318.1 MAG: hypothetical protein A2438_03490 [candidate division WOR-1 bacterium RIFOXYC2_FULL_46_14]